MQTVIFPTVLVQQRVIEGALGAGHLPYGRPVNSRSPYKHLDETIEQRNNQEIPDSKRFYFLGWQKLNKDVVEAKKNKSREEQEYNAMMTSPVGLKVAADQRFTDLQLDAREDLRHGHGHPWVSSRSEQEQQFIHRPAGVMSPAELNEIQRDSMLLHRPSTPETVSEASVDKELQKDHLTRHPHCAKIISREVYKEPCVSSRTREAKTRREAREAARVCRIPSTGSTDELLTVSDCSRHGASRVGMSALERTRSATRVRPVPTTKDIFAVSGENRPRSAAPLQPYQRATLEIASYQSKQFHLGPEPTIGPVDFTSALRSGPSKVQLRRARSATAVQSCTENRHCEKMPVSQCSVKPQQAAESTVGCSKNDNRASALHALCPCCNKRMTAANDDSAASQCSCDSLPADSRDWQKRILNRRAEKAVQPPYAVNSLNKEGHVSREAEMLNFESDEQMQMSMAALKNGSKPPSSTVDEAYLKTSISQNKMRMVHYEASAAPTREQIREEAGIKPSPADLDERGLCTTLRTTKLVERPANVEATTDSQSAVAKARTANADRPHSVAHCLAHGQDFSETAKCIKPTQTALEKIDTAIEKSYERAIDIKQKRAIANMSSMCEAGQGLGSRDMRPQTTSSRRYGPTVVGNGRSLDDISVSDTPSYDNHDKSDFPLYRRVLATKDCEEVEKRHALLNRNKNISDTTSHTTEYDSHCVDCVNNANQYSRPATARSTISTTVQESSSWHREDVLLANKIQEVEREIAALESRGVHRDDNILRGLRVALFKAREKRHSLNNGGHGNVTLQDQQQSKAALHVDTSPVKTDSVNFNYALGSTALVLNAEKAGEDETSTLRSHSSTASSRARQIATSATKYALSKKAQLGPKSASLAIPHQTYVDPPSNHRPRTNHIGTVYDHFSYAYEFDYPRRPNDEKTGHRGPIDFSKAWTSRVPLCPDERSIKAERIQTHIDALNAQLKNTRQTLKKSGRVLYQLATRPPVTIEDVAHGVDMRELLPANNVIVNAQKTQRKTAGV